MPQATKMPAYYLPHGGGPCFFMDWNPSDTWDGMKAFLESIAPQLPEKPKAILVVTAHWLAPAFTVSSGENPALIYDYYGFPPHTYQLRYDAPGDPALAAEIVRRLRAAGLEANEDPQYGFDHGVFIPLKVMFPEADIPVVAMSVRHDLDPAMHIKAGRALESLRDEGVLIVGSGMSFHNMRAYGDPRFTPISEAFDAWLAESIVAPANEREARLAAWEQAPNARLCHPPRAEEHLVPLFVAAGAAGEGAGSRVYAQRVMQTAISGFRFD